MSVDKTIHEICNTNLECGSSEEMTHVIYDTLFQNVDYPQFDVDGAESQECNAPHKQITFVYKGHKYLMSIEMIEPKLCNNCKHGLKSGGDWVPYGMGNVQTPEGIECDNPNIPEEEFDIVTDTDGSNCPYHEQED
jgi:hypothetical protein